MPRASARNRPPTGTRLTPLRPSMRGQEAVWLYQCACGEVVEKLRRYVLSGRVRSCGCLQREATVARNTTHGLAANGRRHSAYMPWASMKQRCHNPNSDDYKHYGARGIRVCERWANSFAAFLEDMGERPSQSHTLERVDNNRGYEPGNVRWATWTDQQRNKRSNVLLTYRGKTQTMAAWAEQSGIPYSAMQSRRARGWSAEEIIETPIGGADTARLKAATAGNNRGERNGIARLTESEVRQIRTHRRWVRPESLAEIFGIAVSTVRGIHYGGRWRHVK